MPGTLVLLAAVLGMSASYVIVMRTLRRFVKHSTPPQPAFDSAELHAMFEKGLISDKEYARLKAIIASQRPRQDAVQHAGGFEVIPVAKVQPVPEPKSYDQ